MEKEKSMPVRQYLECTVLPLLLKALQKLVLERYEYSFNQMDLSFLQTLVPPVQKLKKETYPCSSKTYYNGPPKPETRRCNNLVVSCCRPSDPVQFLVSFLSENNPRSTILKRDEADATSCSGWSIPSHPIHRYYCHYIYVCEKKLLHYSENLKSPLAS